MDFVRSHLVKMRLTFFKVTFYKIHILVKTFVSCTHFASVRATIHFRCPGYSQRVIR